MKFVICRSCGHSMTTGVTYCLCCKDSNLEFHDLYYDSSAFDLTKRLDQLMAPYKKQHASPVWGILAVGLFAAFFVGFHQYAYNPDGYIARTTTAAIQTASVAVPSRTGLDM
ncbi:MAG: hypothetical protein H6677_15490 [Candidatus Obscuribacterales bacterium]|nr:hypothetical protein [Candidatus Obscuribacterales bacterium]